MSTYDPRTEQRDTKGELINGFDYENQAWVVNGKYVRCGHPGSMDCRCYGLRFAGLSPSEARETKTDIEAGIKFRTETRQ